MIKTNLMTFCFFFQADAGDEGEHIGSDKLAFSVNKFSVPKKADACYHHHPAEFPLPADPVQVNAACTECIENTNSMYGTKRLNFGKHSCCIGARRQIWEHIHLGTYKEFSASAYNASLRDTISEIHK